MSVVDQLKNLFSKKSGDSSVDNGGELSLAMPDPSIDPLSSRSMGVASSNNAVSMGPSDPDSVAEEDSSAPLESIEEAELISVPLLGRRTIVTHQRILFTLLALALVVLGSVAIFAVRQADTVAQQMAGTGQSLMQSQRLAKSVSQALVGSAHAFPDVKDRDEVLARTVRGLQSGDEALRMQPVLAEFQEDVAKIVPL